MIRYKVLPNKKISVRKNPEVGSLDKLGELGSGVEFNAEVVIASPVETWGKILDGQYKNGYCAVIHNGQVFADVVSVENPPPSGVPLIMTIEVDGYKAIDGNKKVVVELVPDGD